MGMTLAVKRTRPVCLSPCLLVSLSLCLAGCDLPGKPREADRPIPADQVKDFDVLYSTHCAGCHGADGKLGPGPPLNDPLFLAIVPDEELLRIIREGRAVTPSQKSPMPAFSLATGGSLSPAQAKVWAELQEKVDAAPKQQSPLTTAQVQVLAGGIKKRWGPPAAPGGLHADQPPAGRPAPVGVPPYLAPAQANSG